MRILAIETSGQHGSLATLHGEADTIARLIGQIESQLPTDRTAQSLAPTLQALSARRRLGAQFD